MNSSIDLILTIGAIVIGVLLLTGHGGIFMKGGNVQQRKMLYDEKKMEKASGLALLLIGIVTGINSFTDSFAAKIIYMIVLLVILAVWLYYLRTKCRKK